MQASEAFTCSYHSKSITAGAGRCWLRSREKIDACSVQIPALSDAETKAAIRAFPVPFPRCEAATPAYTDREDSGESAAQARIELPDRATSRQNWWCLAFHSSHVGEEVSKVA